MDPLLIERLAYGGESVGRMPDGKTALIAGGCPGDRVAIEVVEEHERYVRGRIVEVVEPSVHRVPPPCPYFGVCGGCQWQHVSYDQQLAAKRSAVVDALQRIGHITGAESLVGETVPSQDSYGYRNKIELVAETPGGRLALGYHRAGSTEMVPVELCLLPPAKHQRAPKALAGALRYLSGNTDLAISRVQLRVARNTQDVEVAIWTPPGPFPRAAASKTLADAVPLKSLVRVIHKGSPKERRVSKVEVLVGKGHWTEKLGGLAYSVSAPSFFQVNSRVAEKMVDCVLAALSPDGSDRALDLYAGAGTFTLPLAESAGETVAVESYGSAVRDLRRNLENAAVPADVIGGDAAREIASLGRFDLAVVDPPRSGLQAEVIDALASARPRAFAYVSCDPATLARDAHRLEAAGVRLESATPFDLFPQSYHVETVAVFRPGSV